jgi:hypothetical protein
MKKKSFLEKLVTHLSWNFALLSSRELPSLFSRDDLNKTKLLSPLLPLLSRVPRFWSRLPYDVGLFTAQFLLSSFGRVWPRNSYAFDNLLLGVSDLDLTLLLHEELDQARKIQLKRRIYILRFVFPFIAEINIYTNKLVSSLGKYANPFEISRDPELASFLKLESNSFHKVIFLSRMLLSDQQQLRTHFSVRQMKWHRHLISVGIDCKPTQLDELLKTFYTTPPNREAITGLEDYWTSIFNNSSRPDLSSASFIFDPITFLGTDLDFPELNEPEVQVLDYNIQWEIWGIGSQVVLSEPTNTLLHLTRINRLITHYELPHLQEALDILADQLAT